MAATMSGTASVPATMARFRAILATTLRPGRRSIVDAPQSPAVDMAVDLCRAQRAVAQQLLDDAEVGSAFQEMRRERVPQVVGMRNHPAERARVEAATPH